jgi:ligand-binding sensor domain-containing protein
MSHGLITAYPERTTLWGKGESVKPTAVLVGWTNFVSQRCVRAIAISPRSAKMWLATWGGVLSWNRKEEQLYRRYSSEHGLGGNAVACVCVDSAERPWVGHVEGALAYFEGDSWHICDHLQTDLIRVVCPSSDGDGIWAATKETVYRVPGPHERPIAVALEGHDGAVEALDLLDDVSGVLVGNDWGLFRCEFGADPTPVFPEKITSCTCLARDADGRVWVGTPTAVFMIKGAELFGPFAPGESDSPGRVLALAAGKERVWVRTTTGLGQILNDQWYHVPMPSRDEAEPFSIGAIAVSSDDKYLWVGTDRLLASVWSEKPPERHWYLDLLASHSDDELNNVGCCAVAENNARFVRIGTAGGLVEFRDDEEWKLDAIDRHVHVRGLCHCNIGSEQEPREETWMLAWPGGVRTVSGGTGQRSVQQPPGFPMALAVGQDQHAYVVTGRGICRLGDGEAVGVLVAPPAPVRCAAQTPDGVWWLGTTRGVYRWLADRWSFASEPSGPLQAEIHALAVISGTLWAASGDGLWARQADAWQLHEKPLTADRRVVALAPTEDRKALWLASADGVVRFDPEANVVGRLLSPLNSGLASRRITALVETGRRLWIATQAGISRLTLE